jgi:putative ABC transport system ATP-binding protein
VLIDEVDITRLGEDALAKLRGEKVGFVFQFFHLIPSLTAYENVAVPMEIAGVADARPRAEQLLEEGRADRPRPPLSLAALRRRAARVSRWRGRWRTIRRSCSPTNRPVTSTRRTDATSWICSGRFTTGAGRPSSWCTHDAELAAMADARLVLRDGRVVENTLAPSGVS